MKVVTVALAFLWAAISLVTSLFMITSSFLAKTPAKEGIPAQAALLLGGIGIAVMSVAVFWQGARTMRS